MSIRNLPKEVQSYILKWCLKDEKCPLRDVCNESATQNCAVVQFLNNLGEQTGFFIKNGLDIV